MNTSASFPAQSTGWQEPDRSYHRHYIWRAACIGNLSNVTKSRQINLSSQECLFVGNELTNTCIANLCPMLHLDSYDKKKTDPNSNRILYWIVIQVTMNKMRLFHLTINKIELDCSLRRRANSSKCFNSYRRKSRHIKRVTSLDHNSALCHFNCFTYETMAQILLCLDFCTNSLVSNLNIYS